MTKVSEFELVESWYIQPNFLLEVARGNVKNLSSVVKFARDNNVGTTLKDVWAESANIVYMTSAAQLDLVSTDATDNAAGVGARSIRIYGLDADYNEIMEDISLHATDWTIAVQTVNSYLRVYRMQVLTAGSTGGAVWNITLKDWSNTQAIIVDGDNQTLISHYTVPAGKTAYLIYWDLSVWSWKSATGKFFIRPFGEIFRVAQVIDIFETNYIRNFTVPIKITEKSDLVLRAISSSAGTALSMNYDIILVDNVIE